MKEETYVLINKIKKIASKDLNLISILKLFNIFIKVGKEECSEYIKIFIKEYYKMEDNFPNDFYELILNKLYSDDYIYLFDIFTKKNIYSLISYLKYNQENIEELEDAITPLQYYLISRKHINKIIQMLIKFD